MAGSVFAALLSGCQSSESKSVPAPPPAKEISAAEKTPVGLTKPSDVAKVNAALRESGLVATPASITDEDAWWRSAGEACPKGAALRGSPPPDGTEIWCALPDGRKHGRASKWSKLGNKLAEGEHREGVKHGRFTGYHRNGQASMTVTFVDGKEHGKVTTWHANGHKALVGEYRDGKGYGPWTKWDAKGKEVASGTY